MSDRVDVPEKIDPLGAFPEDLGVSIKMLPDKRSEVRLEIASQHLNYEGAVHGGVISSLVDIAIARAIRGGVDESRAIMTVSLNTSFIRGVGVGSGTLIAIGVASTIARTAAFGSAEVYVGEKLVAQGQGTWLIRDRIKSDRKTL